MKSTRGKLAIAAVGGIIALAGVLSGVVARPYLRLNRLQIQN